jgi:hypothetical protein
MTPIKYSDIELTFIKDNSTLPRKELHQIFVNKFNRIDVDQTNLSALCKRKRWLTGRTGRYEKGNIPHPDAKPKGPNSTSFKKGNTSHTWRPVGSERITVDGYYEIKIQEPNVWRLKHLVVWEKINGKLPKGYCLKFLDDNKLNIDPSNLKLISRAENMQLNRMKYSEYPDTLKPSVLIIAQLDCKTRKKATK